MQSRRAERSGTRGPRSAIRTVVAEQCAAGRAPRRRRARHDLDRQPHIAIPADSSARSNRRASFSMECREASAAGVRQRTRLEVRDRRPQRAFDAVAERSGQPRSDEGRPRVDADSFKCHARDCRVHRSRAPIFPSTAEGKTGPLSPSLRAVTVAGQSACRCGLQQGRGRGRLATLRSTLFAASSCAVQCSDSPPAHRRVGGSPCAGPFFTRRW